MSKPQAGPDLPEDVAEVLHDALEGRHRSAESYEEDVREAFQALPKANIDAAAAVCHDMGNEAMKSERYQEAVDHYTSVLAAHPHDNEVLANRSLAYLHLRQGPESLQDAALCVNLMPNWAKGYYRMGCALEECKAYKEAASVFAKVVEMEPENAEASGRLMKARRLACSRCLGSGLASSLSLSLPLSLPVSLSLSRPLSLPLSLPLALSRRATCSRW